MKVNSAKEYRHWIKDKRHRPDVDADFVGCSIEDGPNMVKGFFELFHGMKDDIEKYLPSLLDIAEDNQAIYEFLQNAVDCDATHFWAFYDDQYFLAVNNGSKFDLEGVTSILNIAQSNKTTSSSIGRLGIGFKLAHRLVGKGNGTKELVHSNKGPILFSWDKEEQLRSLMSSESIQHEGLDENPFLFKIAITNFPADVGEQVRDIDYHDAIIFPETELNEMRSYVSLCLSKLFSDNPSCFNQGTLFFIKLGENKRQLLDADLATLKNGIEYSMNTLKQLTNICFNGESITKKQLEILQSSINKDSDVFKAIDPQYREYDILYSFGFLPLDFSAKDYYESVSQLKQSPNFYKYFPMGDEVDNMALFVHSDSFQIEANRRKLLNHHTNVALLQRIAKFITDKLHAYGHNIRNIDDQDKFLQLYASLLLTDKPTAQEKSWMHSIFFDILFAALKEWVPFQNGYSNSTTGIKIKKVKMDFPLDKVGFKTVHWFHWDAQNHDKICDAAKEKLGLEVWNINHVIENADLNQLNAWLDQCSEAEFDAFISEIKATTSSNKVIELLPKIKLFKVGIERKSRDEIMADRDYIISSDQIQSILSALKQVGLKCTDCTIESHPLSAHLKPIGEKAQFIRARVKIEDEENWNKLTPGDKLEVFMTFCGFESVSDAEIKNLKMFKSIDGNVSALNDLTCYRDNVESWQRPYVICKEENFSELQNYLVQSDKFFPDIVERYYANIITSGTTIDELYSTYQRNGIHWKDDFTINLIHTYGSTEEILSLLEKNSSKPAVEEFIKKLGILRISSTQSYPETSFEYRCINIAAKEGVSLLRNRIKIDDTDLTSFASSDELTFICEDSSYRIKLSDVLPDDTQCALYGKVAEKFSSITNYQLIFSADSSNNSVVQNRLRSLLATDGVIISPAQYMFILLTRWQFKYNSLSNWTNYIRFGHTQSQIASTIAQIMDYAFKHDLTEALSKYKLEFLWRQHVRYKYLFCSEYTLENERAYKEIEDWCGEDEQKKEFLKKLDMHFDDCAEITRRKKFKEDALEEWEGESFPSSFISWVKSLMPIEGVNQKKLLLSIADKFNFKYFKKKFEEEDYGGVLELNTPKYHAWKEKEDNPISIYLLDKEMPCRVVYNEDVILRDNVGDYYYFKDTRHLYIHAIEETEVAGVLGIVWQDKTIPLFDFEDYASVCFDSYEEQRAKDQTILKLQEMVDRLSNGNQNRQDEEVGARESQRKDYENTIKSFLEGSFNLDEYNKSSEHIISCYRILCYLKENGYTIAADFDEKDFVKSGRYSTIKLQNSIEVYPSSAKWGVWYIHPNIWRGIVDDGHWACVCTGDKEDDFELIKSEDDLKQVAQLATNVLMKLHPTGFYNVMDVIHSVFPGEKNENMDIHLMIKLHDTKSTDLNSLFDKVFEGDNNDFGI